MARLLAIVYILAIVSSAFGVTIKVEPKSEECFHEDLEQGVEFEVLWNVIDGGLLDVEYKVKRDNIPIFTKMHFEGRDEGKYTYNTPAAGTYSICFNNEMARFTVKTISFSWDMRKDQKATSTEDLTPMQQALDRISSAIEFVEKEQQYMHWREATHRYTAESTNSRVKFWSLAESFILVGMAVGQIYYLRKMVDSKLASRV